jgi:hypothetical protein
LKAPHKGAAFGDDAFERLQGAESDEPVAAPDVQHHITRPKIRRIENSIPDRREALERRTTLVW